MGDAPVSYPYLWNIWKFDWVQYNGSVAQPLARNVGEALGVGAITPLVSDEAASRCRRRSGTAARWTSRAWHASNTRCSCCARRAGRRTSSAPSIVTRRRAAKRCSSNAARNVTVRIVAEPARQQASAPLKTIDELAWRIEVIPLDHIGTDPNAAMGFIERRYDLSRTGLTNADLQDTLRPLLTRSLLRDVRFRLSELVRLRGDAGAPPGELAGGGSRRTRTRCRSRARNSRRSVRRHRRRAVGVCSPTPPVVPSVDEQPDGLPELRASNVTS